MGGGRDKTANHPLALRLGKRGIVFVAFQRRERQQSLPRRLHCLLLDFNLRRTLNR